jgi:hypothetical protein
MNEADCLARQHRRTIATNNHGLVESGLPRERCSPVAELRPKGTSPTRRPKRTQVQRGDRNAEGRTVGESTSLLPSRLFYEVSHCLPPCPKLRLALGHVVPECHVLRQLRDSSSASTEPRTRAPRRCSRNVARSPWPCTFVPASSLIQLSVFLASTIGKRGSSAFRPAQFRFAISSAAWRAAACDRSGSSCPAEAPCPLAGRRPLP